MSLPNLEATWTNRPEEYGIEPPLSLINRIKSIENLRSFGDVTNNYTTYKFSDFEVGKIFFAESLDDGYSALGATNLRFIDPNSVFILPEPKEYVFASNYQFPPQINGYKYDKIIELPKIRTGSIFYRQLGTYSLDACLLAYNRETRELLSSSCVPIFEVSYNVQYYYDSKLRITSRVGRYFPLSLAYGINMEPYGWSNYNPAQLVRSFNSENYDFLRECIRGSFFSFPTLTAVGVTNSISLSLFYSSNLNNNFMDGAINTDLSYFEIFHNIIVVKDGNDLDSIIEGTDEEWEDRISGGEEVIPDDIGPYDPGGTSTGGGGGGPFDYPDPFDQIGETPVGSAEADSSSLGIFTRYLMSRSSLTRFGDYLYSDNLIDAVVMELMKLLYSTPAEALISLISYPFNVSSLLSSTPSNVFFGNGDTGIASDGRLTETAAQINWGSILVKGWTGSFLDFSPHTKFDLYLPWCTGTVSLDPSEILTDRSTGISGDVATGQIQIRTNIEIAKGTCMHMVYNGDGVCLGTYSGVCGSQLPITALDTSGKALAFVTAAVSTIASGAAAAAGAAMGGMASSARTAGAFSPMSEASQLKQATLNGGHSPAVPNYSRGIAGAQAVSRGAARVAVDSARAAAITPPSISRNGSFTANGSGMSIQYPYLIVSYPERDVPEKYSSHYGYPSNIYKQLGSLNGYTEVAAIHLDGISCTEPELSELDELLKGGVIL